MENFDQLELDKFTELADQWWDPNGNLNHCISLTRLEQSILRKKLL